VLNAYYLTQKSNLEVAYKLNGPVQQPGMSIFIKNEFFHGWSSMEETLYFGGKIRKIAFLFPKISQTELFPANKSKIWDNEFCFASPEQLVKVDIPGCCTGP